MKNKKYVGLFILIIIVIGLIITATKGLNVSLIYRKNTTINIDLGIKFDNRNIKKIAEEVYKNQEVIVQKVEVYEDMVAITVENSTEEQEKELVKKINEAYGISKTVENDVNKSENSNIRLRDLIEGCISTLTISFVVIIFYVGIRNKRNGAIDAIYTTLIKVVGAEFLLLSILAITRIPINRLTVPAFLLLYVLIVYNAIAKSENERELQKNSKE